LQSTLLGITSFETFSADVFRKSRDSGTLRPDFDGYTILLDRPRSDFPMFGFTLAPLTAPASLAVKV
jgi:hypothetical protein